MNLHLALLNFGFACWVRFSVHGGTPQKGNDTYSEASEDSSEEMAAEADPLMGTLLGGLMVGGEGKAKAKAKGTPKRKDKAPTHPPTKHKPSPAKRRSRSRSCEDSPGSNAQSQKGRRGADRKSQATDVLEADGGQCNQG